MNRFLFLAATVLFAFTPSLPAEEATFPSLKVEVQAKPAFRDIGAKFLGADCVMSKDMMGGFLHPGSKRSEIWVEEIEENVAKLLAEKK